MTLLVLRCSRLLLVAFFIWIACFARNVVADDREDDSKLSPVEILLRTYDETLGLRWDNRTNWLVNENVCVWKGITCYGSDATEQFQGHVQSLDLSDNHLVGTLPQVVFELPYLQELILRDNPDLHVSFDNVKSAQYLEKLVVSNTIVESLMGVGMAAESLKELHITNLGLNGPFPTAILRLTNLKGLYANYNSLTGYIPSKLGLLTGLTELFLFDNQLTGPIPSELGQLTDLEIMAMAQNAFSGSLPWELENMSKLQIFAVARQLEELKGPGITGNLPSFAKCEALTEVYLENHKISGDIPQDFLARAPRDQVITVDLSNNDISGIVPLTLADFDRLNLNLYDNEISAVPQEFCDAIAESDWFGGDIESMGCTAFLCPPKTYADKGRKTEDGDCMACDANPEDIYGRTTCDAQAGEGGQPGVASERDVLERMYNTMGGRYWNDDSNWLSVDTEPCDPNARWFGLQCNAQGKVTQINMKGNGLTGTPPQDLWASLKDLHRANFASNALDFSFFGIKAASKLLYLDISSTETTSLEDIEELARTPIKILQLSSNFLLEEVPLAVFQITSLEELYISHNKMKGQIPMEIGYLTNLQIFHCYGNAHTGQLPTELGLLTAAKALVFSENQFTGALPEELNKLTDIETISIHQTSFVDNGLSGPLPALQDLKILTQLHLTSNLFSGPLPSNLMANSVRGEELIEVYLGDNDFTGNIPSAWSNRFSKLDVDLSGNQISNLDGFDCGTVPEWMNGAVSAVGNPCDAILCPVGTYNEYGRRQEDIECRPCNNGGASFMGTKTCSSSPPGETNDEVAILNELYFSAGGPGWNDTTTGWNTAANPCSWTGIECNFRGEVVRIDLSENGLTGTPTTRLFELPSLEELDLEDNDIRFDFTGIDKATNLQTLYLSDTSISSLVGIGAAKSLTSLHLTNNNIEGPIPDELFELTNMKYLYLNYNRFSGRLPSNIEKLTDIEELYLMSNRLEGQIPATIGALKKLKIFSLTDNAITGTIPPEVNDLTSIEIFAIQRDSPDELGSELQNNPGTSRQTVGLRGPVPSLNKLQNIQKLYLGNNRLTGTIPYDFLDAVADKSAILEVDLISNALTGQLPPSLVQFSAMQLWVSGNHITGIAPGLCELDDWMDGAVRSYGCDAILCPNGTASAYGRQEDTDSACEQCESDSTASFYGSFGCATAPTQRAAKERRILTRFYHAMNGDNWAAKDNWLSPDVSICEWHGIACTSDSEEFVHDIHLVGNNLKGEVPAGIWELEDLKVLNLASNEIKIWFDNVGDSQLEYLNLDSTGLRHLENMVDIADTLKVLHVNDNAFGEHFPLGIVKLTNLEVLYMSDNALGGSMKPGMQQLTNLIYFMCNNCGLQGQIPDWMSQLSKLENLELQKNAFTDGFPEPIKSLTNLRRLDLSDQHINNGGFTGPLFDFSGFNYLQEVDLSRNEFTGTIPDTFMQDSNPNDIISIDLSWNNLEGTVPAALSKFPQMNLYLSDNQIEEIPDEICSMTTWNTGLLSDGSCDFILCPVGTYNYLGRATPDEPCTTCDQNNTARYFGSTICTENDEKLILDALFIDTQGGSWDNNENWLVNPDICSWYGITCHDAGPYEGKVKFIELSSNNLVGTVPDSIWSLKYMTWLELKDNNLTVADFNGIENAIQLETIYLSDTLQTTIEGIEEAPSLKTLHLTSTKLDGPLPPGLFGMKTIEELFLNYNTLNGPLPPEIGQMTTLRELYLFHNEMTGTLPPEIGLLTNLEILALGENYFHGEIPGEISSLSNLLILSLQRENGGSPTQGEGIGESTGGGMTGRIPSFDGCPNLHQLYLGANSFTGDLPSNFLGAVTNTSAVMQIDVTLNQLTGTVPSGLSKFDNMHFYASGNQISDIPDEVKNKGSWMGGEAENGWDAIMCPPGTYNEWGRRVNDDKPCEDCGYPDSVKFYGSLTCGPTNSTDTSPRTVLREFYLATGGNNWKNRDGWLEDNVEICRWFGVRCSQDTNEIEKLELSNNFLVGAVPPIIFQLTTLRVLDLSENSITCKFQGIEYATSLEDLQLDSTNIDSLKGIGKAASLTTLHVEQNNFGGVIPDEIYDLKALQYLYVSDTGFSGTLSDRFGDLVNLREFYCHGNFISGEIPEAIGQLTALEDLVISENLLYGKLPQAFNDMPSLRVLDLDTFTRSNAGVSGPLLEFEFLPNLRELFLGDNWLTGSIPEKFLAGVNDLDAVINVGLKSNQITGTLPFSLSKFNRLNIDVTENRISDIYLNLCDESDWMNGKVDEFGCDAILCPAGTFNKDGRQSTSELYCIPCNDPGASPYLGSTQCAGVEKEQEKQILQLFYQSTDGDNWKQNTNWMKDDVDICQWFGVSCKDGLFVESLLLGSNNLSGKPPESLFELRNLEFLWLYSNPIDFSFKGIEKARNLKSLLLDSTMVSSIEGLGKGASLEEVDVRFNSLEGTIPSEIRNLHNLQTLMLGNNKLIGTIPSFATNRRLKALRLGDNLLTGTVPALENQYYIEALDLSGNKLEGTIPTNLFASGDTSGSIFLDLSSNKLTGTVPGELARFESATLLLRDNMFTGIHPDLCEKDSFNDGDVGLYNCDAILCSDGTYGPVNGRASQDGDGCLPCDEAQYFGASYCGPWVGDGSSASRTFAGTVGSVVLVLVALFYAVV